MPRIQNGHTATSHFRPGGKFLIGSSFSDEIHPVNVVHRGTIWLGLRFVDFRCSMVSTDNFHCRADSQRGGIGWNSGLGWSGSWLWNFFSIGMLWKGLQTQPVHIEHCVSYMLNFIWYGTFTVFSFYQSCGNHPALQHIPPFGTCGGWKFSLQDIDEFLFVAMVPTKIQMAIQKLEPIKAISWAIWGEGLLEVMFIDVMNMIDMTTGYTDSVSMCVGNDFLTWILILQFWHI